MFKPLIATLVVVAAGLVYIQPPPVGTQPGAMHAAAVIVFGVGMWAFNVLPEHITGILFMLLAVLLGVASPAVVFSGFASSTLWLVFGGLFVAEAVRATGLGQRLARLLLDRFIRSYPAVLVGVSLVATCLAFLMPATMGRVLLLVPVMSALAGRMGFGPGSNGYNGILLSALAGTYHAGVGILPANAPNMVLAGAAETLYGVELIYGKYCLVQFPIWGLLKILICAGFTLLLFPARPEPAEAETRLLPVSQAEKRLMVILGAALALWATDFLHHIHAGWIALAAAMACIAPGIGVLPLEAFNERVRFGPFFYVGAVLGLGGIMTESGLTAAVGDRLVAALDLRAGADALNFGILVTVATATGFVTTSAAQPALLAPLTGEIAEVVGWPILAVLMTLAAGYSTVILPHTVPPLMVGLRVANISFRDAIRYTITTGAVGFVALVPLAYAWWRVLGFLG